MADTDNQKDYLEISRRLGESLRKDPNIANRYEKLCKLAEAHMKLRKYNEAIETAIKAQELDPIKYQAYYQLGRTLTVLGDVDKAESAFLIASEKSNKDEAVLEQLYDLGFLLDEIKNDLLEGKTAVVSGNYLGAVSAFTAVIQQKNQLPIIYLYRALAATGLKDIVQATADALKLVELYPDWPREKSTYIGYLDKQGEKIFDTYKRRYFVLREYFLYYYKSEKDVTPQGVIICRDIQVSTKDGGKSLQLTTPRRIYQLKAPSIEEAAQWSNFLELLIHKKSWNLPTNNYLDRILNQKTEEEQSAYSPPKSLENKSLQLQKSKNESLRQKQEAELKRMQDEKLRKQQEELPPSRVGGYASLASNNKGRYKQANYRRTIADTDSFTRELNKQLDQSLSPDLPLSSSPPLPSIFDINKHDVVPPLHRAATVSSIPSSTPDPEPLSSTHSNPHPLTIYSNPSSVSSHPNPSDSFPGVAGSKPTEGPGSVKRSDVVTPASGGSVERRKMVPSTAATDDERVVRRGMNPTESHTISPSPSSATVASPATTAGNSTPVSSSCACVVL